MWACPATIFASFLLRLLASLVATPNSVWYVKRGLDDYFNKNRNEFQKRLNSSVTWLKNWQYYSSACEVVWAEFWGRLLAQSASSASGITERYASALFDLAVSEKKLAPVEKDLARFDALLKGSDSLMQLVRSPVFTADDQLNAVDAILKKSKITGLVGNFVRVIARNRRLFAMPGMLSVFRRFVSEHKGEITAEVTVAKALSAQQNKELKAALKSVVGKDVAIDAIIDPSLLGGMIVKVGSRQIDTSLRTKLSSLKLALKEVD